MKTTRRGFLSTTAAAGAMAAVSASDALAGASLDATLKQYKGPHEMPRGLTLVSIKQGSTESLGVKTDAGILDVRAAAKMFKMDAPETLDALLQDGNASALKQLIEKATRSSKSISLFLDEAAIRHGRLFVNPGKILCVGLNYREHVKEAGEKVPSVPILFNKYNSTLNSHQTTIKLPVDVAKKFDYEVELLVVIGKQAKNVSEADALNYVAGYCTSNDFSARDLQLELDGGQWMLGKTLDGFAPIGPYFVSADLVPDPNALAIECKVNGEVRQHSNTSLFIYNTQYLIAYISKYITLEPGDIIFTGTPSGVIVGYPKDKQVWLKAGDQISCTVGNLGELKFDLA